MSRKVSGLNPQAGRKAVTDKRASVLYFWTIRQEMSGSGLPNIVFEGVGYGHQHVGERDPSTGCEGVTALNG
jgi:hypothetical protein